MVSIQVSRYDAGPKQRGKRIGGGKERVLMALNIGREDLPHTFHYNITKCCWGQ